MHPWMVTRDCPSQVIVSEGAYPTMKSQSYVELSAVMHNAHVLRTRMHHKKETYIMDGRRAVDDMLEIAKG